MQLANISSSVFYSPESQKKNVNRMALLVAITLSGSNKKIFQEKRKNITARMLPSSAVLHKTLNKLIVPDNLIPQYHF